MFGKLLILFILIPLAELYLFTTLGKEIGFGPTILIIVITAIIGASLTRSQGHRAIEKLHKATGEGRLPAREAFDGVMILLAGAVLITPGFLTDAVGFLLLVPPIRAIVAGYLGEKLKKNIKVVTPASPPPESKPKSKLDDGNVIDV